MAYEKQTFIDNSTILTAEMMEHIEDGICNNEWVLVWENASPSSSFSPQTIALDLADTAWIAVNYKASTSGSVRTIDMIEVGENRQLVLYANAGASGTTELYTRRVNVSATGVEFEKGTKKTVSGSSVDTANGNVIPLKIYALKGVVK